MPHKPPKRKKVAAAAPKSAVANKPIVAQPGKKLLLHIGCGVASKEKLPKVFQGDEWQEVRLDIDPEVKPDIVASMTDMKKEVADNSVDAVFSSHNLEHLYPHLVPVALKEFNRVIKPEGVVVITMPDLQSISAYIAEGMLEEPLYGSAAGGIAPIDVVYGWRSAIGNGNTFMAHRGGVSAKSLAQHLGNAGFSNIVIRRQWIDLWATAYKFPKGHPQRRENVTMVNASLTGPDKQELPFWYKRKLMIEANPEVHTDELDVPPSFYQPLELKS